MEKLNSEIYVEGTVKIGELKITKPGILKQIFDLPADADSIIYGHAPIIMEIQKVSILEALLSCYDSDKILKRQIGDIRLYRGIIYTEGMNPTYFDNLVVNINKNIKLIDGQIPKCELTFHKEYDPKSDKIYVETRTNGKDGNENTTQKSALNKLLPDELFTSKNSESDIVKFWKIVIGPRYTE